ncbi:MAG TPA: HEAT repeat domain-containing protein, partial [Candidatus Acidoferrum sp.]|nr:HEAT repeat domain-containing protein [Candidatus Acidoferrum sp.]
MDGTDPNAAVSLPADTQAMIERSLSNPHAVVRLKAIEAAARLNTSAVIPLLHPVLNDTDARVRGAVVELVARHADAEASTLARQLFDTLPAEERSRFVDSLSHRGDAAAEALLTNFLTAESAPDLQAILVRSLGFA